MPLTSVLSNQVVYADKEALQSRAHSLVLHNGTQNDQAGARERIQFSETTLNYPNRAVSSDPVSS